MRIRYVNPVASGTLDDWFAERLAGAGGADVEVEVGHLEIAGVPDSPFLPAATSYQGPLLDAIARAEADGCDGVVIGCSGDPAILDARRSVAIPVAAPLDAALHLAAQLHQRMAILVADGFEAHVLYRDLARYYGLDHLISEILTVPMEYPEAAALAEAMHADQDAATFSVIDRHRAVLDGPALELARGAVERGAGVVYAGCTFWTGEMLDPFRAALGVPVVDPGRGAVEMAAAAARATRAARVAA